MPCPSHVNIPGCFAAYNTSYAIGYLPGLKQYVMNIGATSEQMSGPGLCVACGRCEEHCPQKIPVIDALKKLRRRLEPFWMHWGVTLFRKMIRGQ
jgi:predicted aldo/keto reductase-like oxidoreductase